MPERTRVLVTGASGQTGALIVAELLASGRFDVRVAVRSDAARQLMLDLGVALDAIHRLDLSSDVAGSQAALRLALGGCEALVICTSAVPQVSVARTLAGALWQQCCGRRGEPFVPVASWKAGQTPEQVDWLGQRTQIDAAKQAGVQHVVLVSSAGGCDPQHFLNHIGRGDILNHKRRAEQHLMCSGVPCWTILHPNHLVNRPAGGHELVLGVDDAIQKPHWRSRLKMPRAELARLAVACLLLRDEGAGNRSIDVAARPVPPSQATAGVEAVRALLAAMPHNCSYAINDRTAPDAAWACRQPT